MVITLLVALYLAAALASSREKPLWHDELFTWHIAQAPTVAGMLCQIRSLDLNPPLTYLLTRISFHLFGTGILATRLPEIFSYLFLLVAVYRFVCRRMGVCFATFAIALLLAGNSLPMAVEARPYSLLLGLLALALLAWQTAKERQVGRRTISLWLLGTAILFMMLSHIFAVFALASLLAAEAFLAVKTRCIDWPVLLALLLPSPAILTYMPLVRTHGAAIYPPAFQPDGATIFAFYIGAVESELVVLLLAALIVLLVSGPRRLQASPPAQGHAWSFAPAEWVVLIGLMLFPLGLLGWLAVHHGAWFPRYGAASLIGFALLAAALLARWTTYDGKRNPGAALAGSVVALLISAVPFAAIQEIASGRLRHPLLLGEPVLAPCDACTLSARPDAHGQLLPLVDASGLTFVEMNHRETGATLDRLFYLTDPAASRELAHANIFERMSEVADAFHFRGHVKPYRNFILEHPTFYVLGEYDYPEDWLLPQLVKDGATLQLLSYTRPAYKQVQLYRVSFPTSKFLPQGDTP